MTQLSKEYQVDVLGFASPVYWQNSKELTQSFEGIKSTLVKTIPDGIKYKFNLLKSESDVDSFDSLQEESAAVFIPMSGGVQPWMTALGKKYAYVGLFNAYLPDSGIPDKISRSLMMLNAHPACTDFYAFINRQNKYIKWLANEVSLSRFVRSYAAVKRLKNAVFLMIGDTEPWVINSTRDPKTFKDELGCIIIPVDKKELYSAVDNVDENMVNKISDQWISNSSELEGIVFQDVTEAVKVNAGMLTLLNKHNADGLAMACFSMIGDIDTTSCLALSRLNDSPGFIGACEGDLDAAVTLFLMKALGADFIWMGNPIIYEEDSMDVVHCTAPCSACGKKLDYKLMRHHESGRGVSPEVVLPLNETVTFTRIGNGLKDIIIGTGTTMKAPKLPSCRTQIRLKIPSTGKLLDNLMGTHLIISYGSFVDELKDCADMLNLNKRQIVFEY